MPIDDLDREVRDLFTRILAAGRREGERTAADRVVGMVRDAAAPAAARPSAPADSPAAAPADAPQETPAPAAHGHDTPTLPHPAGPGRLPPYWRPR